MTQAISTQHATSYSAPMSNSSVSQASPSHVARNDRMITSNSGEHTIFENARSPSSLSPLRNEITQLTESDKLAMTPPSSSSPSAFGTQSPFFVQAENQTAQLGDSLMASPAPKGSSKHEDIPLHNTQGKGYQLIENRHFQETQNDVAHNQGISLDGVATGRISSVANSVKESSGAQIRSQDQVEPDSSSEIEAMMQQITSVTLPVSTAGIEHSVDMKSNSNVGSLQPAESSCCRPCESRGSRDSAQTVSFQSASEDDLSDANPQMSNLQAFRNSTITHPHAVQNVLLAEQAMSDDGRLAITRSISTEPTMRGTEPVDNISSLGEQEMEIVHYYREGRMAVVPDEQHQAKEAHPATRLLSTAREENSTIVVTHVETGTHAIPYPGNVHQSSKEHALLSSEALAPSGSIRIQQVSPDRADDINDLGGTEAKVENSRPSPSFYFHIGQHVLSSSQALNDEAPHAIQGALPKRFLRDDSTLDRNPQRSQQHAKRVQCTEQSSVLANEEGNQYTPEFLCSESSASGIRDPGRKGHETCIGQLQPWRILRSGHYFAGDGAVQQSQAPTNDENAATDFGKATTGGLDCREDYQGSAGQREWTQGQASTPDVRTNTTTKSLVCDEAMRTGCDGTIRDSASKAPKASDSAWKMRQNEIPERAPQAGGSSPSSAEKERSPQSHPILQTDGCSSSETVLSMRDERIRSSLSDQQVQRPQPVRSTHHDVKHVADMPREIVRAHLEEWGEEKKCSANVSNTAVSSQFVIRSGHYFVEQSAQERHPKKVQNRQNWQTVLQCESQIPAEQEDDSENSSQHTTQHLGDVQHDAELDLGTRVQGSAKAPEKMRYSPARLEQNGTTGDNTLLESGLSAKAASCSSTTQHALPETLEEQHGSDKMLQNVSLQRSEKKKNSSNNSQDRKRYRIISGHSFAGQTMTRHPAVESNGHGTLSLAMPGRNTQLKPGTAREISHVLNRSSPGARHFIPNLYFEPKNMVYVDSPQRSLPKPAGMARARYIQYALRSSTKAVEQSTRLTNQNPTCSSAAPGNQQLLHMQHGQMLANTGVLVLNPEYGDIALTDAHVPMQRLITQNSIPHDSTSQYIVIDETRKKQRKVLKEPSNLAVPVKVTAPKPQAHNRFEIDMDTIALLRQSGLENRIDDISAAALHGPSGSLNEPAFKKAGCNADSKSSCSRSFQRNRQKAQASVGVMGPSGVSRGYEASEGRCLGSSSLAMQSEAVVANRFAGLTQARLSLRPAGLIDILPGAGVVSIQMSMCYTRNLGLYKASHG